MKILIIIVIPYQKASLIRSTEQDVGKGWEERIENKSEERRISLRETRKRKKKKDVRRQMARLQSQDGRSTGSDGSTAIVDEVASTSAGEVGLLGLLGGLGRGGSAGFPDTGLGGRRSRGGGSNQRRSGGEGGGGRARGSVHRRRGGVRGGAVRVLTQTELNRVLVAEGGLVNQENTVVGHIGLVAGRFPQEGARVGNVLGNDVDGHDVLAWPAQQLQGDGARRVGLPGDLEGLTLWDYLAQLRGEDRVALRRLAVVGLEKLRRGRSRGQESGDSSDKVTHGE